VIDQYTVTTAITLLVVAYAAARGDSPERWCAAAIGVETVVDFTLHYTIGPRSFSEFNLSRLVFDMMKASVFITVALRANRVYPLGVAAAGVVAVIGSIPALLNKEGWNQAYWAMTNTPTYLQVVLLAAGTVAHRKRLALIGPYNCWSPRPAPARQAA